MHLRALKLLPPLPPLNHVAEKAETEYRPDQNHRQLAQVHKRDVEVETAMMLGAVMYPQQEGSRRSVVL
jgi:hypothetical protein